MSGAHLQKRIEFINGDRSLRTDLSIHLTYCVKGNNYEEAVRTRRG